MTYLLLLCEDHPLKMGKSKNYSEDTRPTKTPKKPSDSNKPSYASPNGAEYNGGGIKNKIKQLSSHDTEFGSDSDDFTPDHDQSEQEDLKSYIKTLPTAEHMKDMFKELTNTLKSDLAEIKSDVKQIYARVHTLEESNEQISQHASRLEDTVKLQQRELYELKLHVDDLENRSRRNNLRIRGLTEQIEDKNIHTVIQQIFLELLGKDGDEDLGLERVHRVYRPKNAPKDAPRDVLCYILSFRLKEEILSKARFAKSISYEGSEITIFQDVSKYTLDKRRQLATFTRALRDNKIKYRWLYPFGILISHNNRTFTVKSPEELAAIVPKLNIGQVEIPDWTLEGTTEPFPALPDAQQWERQSTSKQRRMNLFGSTLPKTPKKNLKGPITG